MIEGDLPNRAQNLVTEWAQLYKNELMAMWKSQEFKQLPGLEKRGSHGKISENYGCQTSER